MADLWIPGVLQLAVDLHSFLFLFFLKGLPASMLLGDGQAFTLFLPQGLIPCCEKGIIVDKYGEGCFQYVG